MHFNLHDKNFLSHIVESELCIGCGLCVGLFGEDAVKLSKNNHGYFTPVEVKPLTIEQRVLLSHVCPGVTVRHAENSIKYHPVWGPYLNVSTGYAADANIRYKGSSGGVVSALLIYLLETGFVDSVLQIGTSSVNPLYNEVKISRCREDVLSCAGSRYSPSAPLVTIGEVLNHTDRFAFVGKPCDVAALRQLEQYDNRVQERIVVMLSFMCAGVPSLYGTEEVLKHFGAEPNQVASFKYRGDGWPGFTKAVMKDGTEYQMNYEESWGKILNRHLQLRCKICPDGTGEFADIVGADAWVGRDDGYPDFTEHEGMSLVIARTERGRKIFDSSVKSGTLIKEASLTINEIKKIQPYQANRKQTLFSRLVAMKIVMHKFPNYDWSSIVRAAIYGGMLIQLRSFLGMLLRELRRKKRIKLTSID